MTTTKPTTISGQRRAIIFTRISNPAKAVYMPDSKAPTHVAFAMKRLRKTRFIWLEIGRGSLDSNGVFHGFLDRMPIGGFTGDVYFAPIGSQPPLPDPERPPNVSNRSEEEDEN